MLKTVCSYIHIMQVSLHSRYDMLYIAMKIGNMQTFNNSIKANMQYIKKKNEKRTHALHLL